MFLYPETDMMTWYQSEKESFIQSKDTQQQRQPEFMGNGKLAGGRRWSAAVTMHFF
jgi:hypothetical protein